MPEKKTVRRARKDAREGKSLSTQAGEFVREEIEHIRKGRHGARNVKQAIAIGLSKARQAGIPLPARGKSGRKAKPVRSRRLRAQGQRVSAKRSRAIRGVLKNEPRSAGSRRSLARQARSSARKRGAQSRQSAAQRAVRTKGKPRLRQAARKAARTRQARRGSA